jgi:hypothetical protein
VSSHSTLHGVVFDILVGGRRAAPLPAFAAAKIPFGNRLLTMISVWLEA